MDWLRFFTCVEMQVVYLCAAMFFIVLEIRSQRKQREKDETKKD